MRPFAAPERQPTVRPIQRLTAGRIGSDFMTLDSVDSDLAALVAGFAAGTFFALPAVPFAVAGAVFFFGFSSAVVRAALGAADFGAAFASAADFGATFAGAADFTAAFFATGAFAIDFLLVFFFAPLAAIPVLHVPGVLSCFARPTASDTMHLAMAKRLARPARLFVSAALATLALGVAVADARDVTFPIRLDDRFLTRELAGSAFTDADGTAHVFADESGCNSLVLFDPRVTSEPGALRVRSAGEARFGVSAGGRCLLPLSWSGQIELIEEPRIERGAPVVRFVVADSRLLDPDGGEPLFSGTLWGWVKEYVHPRLETRVDLSEPIAQLREVLPAFGVGEPGSPLDEALGRVSLDDVEPSDGVVQVRVRIAVPDTAAADATPEPAGSVAPLSPEELRRWQQSIEQWDAFLTFVVKITGADTQVLALRRTLLSILLDERYALSEALTRPDASVHDPVRPLFLRAWQRLAPALREVADGLPADQALRYLSFVSAGDALTALDQLGPDSGIEISADGLRRLARLMVPSPPEDPLAYTPGVDPQLRELFGFGAPIPAPEENPEVDADAGAASGDGPDDAAAGPSPGAGGGASPAPTASPAPGPGVDAAAGSSALPAVATTSAAPPPAGDGAPGPPANPVSPGALPAPSTSPVASPASRAPAAAPATSAPPGAGSATSAPPDAGAGSVPVVAPDGGATSWLWGWLGGTAWAAELPEPDVVKRLNSWAPTRTDIAEYAPLARRLLDDVTTFLLARHEIDPAHADVFRALVPATAWKESCWRQYVEKGGKLVPLTSGAGAVGIMQVNVSVWRGFYDVGGLKRDIAYNARAGGEILSRYWTDYAVPRGEAKKGGGVDALARATYAAYNGGPSELARYRDRKAAKRERLVDTDFFVKYQRMKAGEHLAVVDCYLD